MTHLTTLKKARKKGTNLNNYGNSDVTEKLTVKDRLQPMRLLHPWDFPGKSTGVGCHCLPRLRLNIFPQKASTVGPPYLLRVSYPWIQPTSEKNNGENIFQKVPRSKT